MSVENATIQETENLEQEAQKTSDKNVETFKEYYEAAVKRFRDTIDMVNERYEDMPEGEKESFIQHNNDILYSAIELGVKKDFSEKEMKTLELTAILHDMTKANKHPEFKDVPFYDLVIHGEEAAAEVPDILTDEYLKEKGFEGDFEEVRNQVANAIREHMGPHPGFMKMALGMANKKLEEMGEQKIEHPKAKGRISEAMLAADMRSLAGIKGREKVMNIRYNFKLDKDADIETAKLFNERGVDLTPGEAALLSSFRSAFEARDMIEDPDLRTIIIEDINESMEKDYDYGPKDKPDEIVSPESAFSKQREYDKILAEGEDEEKVKEIKRKMGLAA